jgi:hypothetical protein
MSTNAATGSVHTGFWVDWSTDSAVTGTKLTLTSQSGAYFVAFLALFVRIAGGHIFGILSYLIFRWRSTLLPSDAIHFQLQAILRNANSDARAMFEFLMVGLSWRNRCSKPLLRPLSLALFALINIAAFAAAGIFSSRVASSNGDVLLRKSLCGGFQIDDTSNIGVAAPSEAAYKDYTAYLKDSEIRSASYYQNCNGLSTDDGCPPLGRRWLTWNTTYVACPFDSAICAINTAIRIDTGLLDSHLHFGINSKKKDRLNTRWVTECAPIKTEGYRSDWLPLSDPVIQQMTHAEDMTEGLRPSTDPNFRFLRFHYGPDLTLPTALALQNNVTFIWSNSSISLWQIPSVGYGEVQSYALK